MEKTLVTWLVLKMFFGIYWRIDRTGETSHDNSILPSKSYDMDAKAGRSSRRLSIRRIVLHLRSHQCKSSEWRWSEVPVGIFNSIALGKQWNEISYDATSSFCILKTARPPFRIILKRFRFLKPIEPSVPMFFIILSCENDSDSCSMRLAWDS